MYMWAKMRLGNSQRSEMFSRNLMEVRFEASYRIRQGLEGTASDEL